MNEKIIHTSDLENCDSRKARDPQIIAAQQIIRCSARRLTRYSLTISIGRGTRCNLVPVALKKLDERTQRRVTKQCETHKQKMHRFRTNQKIAFD
jgi:hypothetical protein